MSDEWASSAAPPDVLAIGGGLELRRWRPGAGDLDALAQAVMASLDHLRPWMPWANGFDRDSAAGFLDGAEAGWTARTEFPYGIREGDTVLGSTGLHGRIGPGRLEIGYWVHVDRVGEGIARRAAAALVAAAFTLPDVDAVEIRHDPANVPSGRIPEVLGFRHIGVLRIGSTDDSVERDTSSVWELTREDHQAGSGRVPS